MDYNRLLMNKLFKRITIGIIQFPEVNLKKSEIQKFRGFIGNEYKKYDIIHNHDENGRFIYRYPKIQFKEINKTPAIYAIEKDAISIFNDIYFKTDYLRIGNKNLILHEKQLKIHEYIVGISESEIVYKFISPWIGLNSARYNEYKNADDQEQNRIISGALMNNIISFCKSIKYQITERLEIKHKLWTTTIKLKGSKQIGFLGNFKIKMHLPQYIGLGKSTSRGFGVVEVVL
ncbi:MAG: DNA repair protein [Spirochaetes bacterium]|nr:DNA repair protein [Spirochaetota bacterium]